METTGAAAGIGTITYGIGALAYVVLLGLLGRRPKDLPGALILVGIATTLAWTGLAAAYYWGAALSPQLIAAFELLRFFAWIAFLASLVDSGFKVLGWRLGGTYVVPVAILVIGGLLTVGGLVMRPGPILSEAVNPSAIVGLALAVVGLFLTEILYRSTPAEERWRIKFLCLALGTIFACDLFHYADAELFGEVDPALQQARGAVQALVAPMLAIAAARNLLWKTNISLSRQMVVGSTTLIASGLYLSLAAGVGYLLREIHETRGPVVQIIFFVGAVAVLAIVLFSGTYWAHAKLFINKHFYKHKYDWREEWLRFMQTLSTGQSAAPLEERCIKSVADIVESPGGAMWLVDGERYWHACSWNFQDPALSDRDAAAVAECLMRAQTVIDLRGTAEGSETYEGASIPAALKAVKRAWLVIPLWHRRLVGFVILARPRAPITLGWEDYDLLNVVGRQVASYLAEHKALEALEDAREFDIFSRRFAFVIHDVKNLVSQLSVLGSNFEKHGHRKEFRDDVVATLNDASDKMKRLMDRIHAFKGAEPANEPLFLEPLIRRIVAGHPGVPADLLLESGGPGLAVSAEGDRLEAVIGHLVQNAAEAVGGTGKVTIALKRDGAFATIDVIDNGPGMDRDFIRRDLFKPFQSTKNAGMGLGAYQCREYARELGGNLEAISAPGQGTTMRITLPVIDAPAQRAAPSLAGS